MSKPIVLMYHGFGERRPEADPHNLFVPRADLERQLRYVRRHRHPLDLDAYLRGLRVGRWPRRSALVTMDDGYVSTLEVAGPLLRELGIPAVAFVCPGRLGGSSAWMDEMPGEALLDAEGIRALAGFGIEVGAHGLDHTLLPGLRPDDLEAQVRGSADAVAEITGSRPRAFAYPEGSFDAPALRAVERAGYEVGFSVERDEGPFAVARAGITSRDSMLSFRAKLLRGFRALDRMAGPGTRVRRAGARLLGHGRS